MAVGTARPRAGIGRAVDSRGDGRGGAQLALEVGLGVAGAAAEVAARSWASCRAGGSGRGGRSQRARGPPRVVVRRVLSERPAEVSLAEDQHAVGEFGSDGSTRSVRRRSSPSATRRIFTTAIPASANTASNEAANCPARSRMWNRNRATRSPRSMTRLRACWVVQGPSGWPVTPRMCRCRNTSSSTSLVDVARPSSRARPSTCWKTSYSSRSVIAAIMNAGDRRHRWSAACATFWNPTGWAAACQCAEDGGVDPDPCRAWVVSA
jgi:hypothetical protein